MHSVHYLSGCLQVRYFYFYLDDSAMTMQYRLIQRSPVVPYGILYDGYQYQQLVYKRYLSPKKFIKSFITWNEKSWWYEASIRYCKIRKPIWKVRNWYMILDTGNCKTMQCNGLEKIHGVLEWLRIVCLE